jgi:hypothetical protein
MNHVAEHGRAGEGPNQAEVTIAQIPQPEKDAKLDEITPGSIGQNVKSPQRGPGAAKVAK